MVVGMWKQYAQTCFINGSSECIESFAFDMRLIGSIYAFNLDSIDTQNPTTYKTRRCFEVYTDSTGNSSTIHI